METDPSAVWTSHCLRTSPGAQGQQPAPWTRPVHSVTALGQVLQHQQVWEWCRPKCSTIRKRNVTSMFQKSTEQHPLPAVCTGRCLHKAARTPPPHTHSHTHACSVVTDCSSTEWVIAFTGRGSNHGNHGCVEAAGKSHRFWVDYWCSRHGGGGGGCGVVGGKTVLSPPLPAGVPAFGRARGCLLPSLSPQKPPQNDCHVGLIILRCGCWGTTFFGGPVGGGCPSFSGSWSDEAGTGCGGRGKGEGTLQSPRCFSRPSRSLRRDWLNGSDMISAPHVHRPAYYKTVRTPAHLPPRTP